MVVGKGLTESCGDAAEESHGRASSSASLSDRSKDVICCSCANNVLEESCCIFVADYEARRDNKCGFLCRKC